MFEELVIFRIKTIFKRRKWRLITRAFHFSMLCINIYRWGFFFFYKNCQTWLFVCKILRFTCFEIWHYYRPWSVQVSDKKEQKVTYMLTLYSNWNQEQNHCFSVMEFGLLILNPGSLCHIAFCVATLSSSEDRQVHFLCAEKDKNNIGGLQLEVALRE